MEHLKRQIEMLYTEIFVPLFVNDPEGQRTLVKTAAIIYNRNHTRCLQVLEKLWQMGIIQTNILIQYGLSADSEDSIAHKILSMIIQRAFELRSFLVTLHT